MALDSDVDGRVRRLEKLFRDVTDGRRNVTTSSDARLFIEAMLSHDSPSICIEKIVASPSGLEALRRSVRADLSLPFIQTHILALLGLMSQPEIKALADGQILKRLVHVIVCPPTVWHELVKYFLAGQIADKDLPAFAWLTHELITNCSEPELDILSDAQAILQAGKLSQSTVHATRELAYKVANALQLRAASLSVNTSFLPGGRHDNDFSDFRKIDIYPTADELRSNEAPFYRQSHEVFELPLCDRAAAHLDNQFRLLREDLLTDLREDLKLALGQRRGRRSGLALRIARPIRLVLDDRSRGKKSSLAVSCAGGLEQLERMPENQRRKFLEDNGNYLKHQVFGALLREGVVCGFAFVDRNVDMLCQNPPIVCLQFTDSQALGKVLLALRSPENLDFILVDVPFFAYEPILDQLKSMTELPLQDVLLGVKDSSQGFEDLNKLDLRDGIQYVVTTLQSRLTEPSVYCQERTFKGMESSRWRSFNGVDSSQLTALASALSQRVSIIQGPPGKLCVT